MDKLTAKAHRAARLRREAEKDAMGRLRLLSTTEAVSAATDRAMAAVSARLTEEIYHRIMRNGDLREMVGADILRDRAVPEAVGRAVAKVMQVKRVGRFANGGGAYLLAKPTSIDTHIVTVTIPKLQRSIVVMSQGAR